jgi:hypothetical protein
VKQNLEQIGKVFPDQWPVASIATVYWMVRTTHMKTKAHLSPHLAFSKDTIVGNGEKKELATGLQV